MWKNSHGGSHFVRFRSRISYSTQIQMKFSLSFIREIGKFLKLYLRRRIISLPFLLGFIFPFIEKWQLLIVQLCHIMCQSIMVQHCGGVSVNASVLKKGRGLLSMYLIESFLLFFITVVFFYRIISVWEPYSGLSQVWPATL